MTITNILKGKTTDFLANKGKGEDYTKKIKKTKKEIDPTETALKVTLSRAGILYSDSLVSLMQDYSPDRREELEAILKEINILDETDRFEGLIVDTPGVSPSDQEYPWIRAGSESYLFIPRIQATDKSKGLKEKKIAVKAIITLLPNISIKSQLNRYEILKDEDIKVVNIYAISKGCIIQRYIPYPATKAFEQKNIHLLEEIANIAAKLDKRGFTTLDFINDMRTNFKDVFYTDFGCDLGVPGNMPKDDAFKKLIQYINKYPSLANIKENLIQRYQKS